MTTFALVSNWLTIPWNGLFGSREYNEGAWKYSEKRGETDGKGIK
jgi:hypothetical protein